MSDKDVLEELHNIFNWNPPILQFAIGHGCSERDLRNARQVAFYDMHLASDHVCKRVVHVPSLHRNIAHIVDEKMQKIHSDKIILQQPSTGDFTDTAAREEKVERNCMPLSNRQTVVSYYAIVTSDCCLPIASSLAFHPHVWRSVITWSVQPQSIALGSHDPSLHIIHLDTAKGRFGPEVMDEEVLEKLTKMATRRKDLATWEVLSLSIDDIDAMLGVLTMAAASADGEFEWKTTSGTPCTPGDGTRRKIPSSKRAADALEALALVEPYCHVGYGSSNLDVASGSPDDILDASLQRGGSSLEAVREDISAKEAIIISYLETAGSETDSEGLGFGADPREQASWKPPGAGHAASQELIQKAWSQSVRQNTTLLVLHAGNYEYVCIRHRETQTLYISDILHIPFLKDPGYGKVQIGIYITALEDALRRFTLDSLGDSSGTRKKPAKKRPVTNSSGGRSKKRQRTIDDIEWCVQQAASREYLLLHVCYSIYDTIKPQIYHRAPIVDSDDERTPERAAIISDVPPDARLLLFLNSELGQGNTGVVHGGVLEVETENKKSRLAIAAKLSFSDEQRDRLQEEWSIYMHLTLEGVEGIPPLLGIFYDPDIIASPLCLLTCHAGVSLARSGQSITSAQRDAFLAALQSIHRAAVHHGDLRYDNLLIKDSGEVAIIDFDQAKRDATQSSRSEEYHKLRRLLDNRVDDSKPAVNGRTRAHKERNNIEVVNVRRITRSMGAVRQTLGGMTLRPRR